MSIHCPYCGAPAATILTRTNDNAVRRRHRCTADPKHMFSTVQVVVKDYQRTPTAADLEEKP